MRNVLTTIMIAALTALPLAGCAPSTPSSFPATADSRSVQAVSNFRLLISDEPNAIGEFEELWITISGIGFVPAGTGGGVTEITLEQAIEVTLDQSTWVNLVELIGVNAVVLWEGNLPAGNYIKVFLYVESVTGLLDGSEDPVQIKLPSNKLQLNLSFTVGEEDDGEITDFVFDIAVIRAGNSGQYLLKPQLNRSGTDQPYRLLERTRDRIRTGPPDWAGRPGWVDASSAGRPDWVPHEDDNGWVGLPDWVPRPEWAGRPEWTPADGKDDEGQDDSGDGLDQGAG